MSDMDARLLALIDIEEIRQLRMQYSRSLDTGEIDGFDCVFSADARVVVTIGEMKGLDAIKAGLKDAYRKFDRDGREHYPFLHVIANHQITLTGRIRPRGNTIWSISRRHGSLIRIRFCCWEYITTGIAGLTVLGGSRSPGWTSFGRQRSPPTRNSADARTMCSSSINPGCKKSRPPLILKSDMLAPE